MRFNKIYLYVLSLFFTVFPVFAQEFDDGIEPPPTAPIDGHIGVLGVLAVLFSAFIFFKKTFKLKQDDNTVT
jgi:hypothetical protein